MEGEWQSLPLTEHKGKRTGWDRSSDVYKRQLKEQYAKIVAEGGDMVIDPSLLGSDADGIKGGFDAVIAMKDTKLADMSVAQPVNTDGNVWEDAVQVHCSFRII